MRCLLLCLLLFSVLTLARGQQDSLLAVIAKPTNDTADLNALRQLSTTIYRQNFPLAMAYARRLGRLGAERKLPRWSATGYRSLGVFHYMESRIDSFSYYTALAMSQLGDPANEPKVGVGLLINKGVIATIQLQLDDAIGAYAKAYDLAIASGYDQDVPKILNNLGVIYRKLGRYRSAERTYRRSLELKEAAQDSLGIANTLHNLGRVEIKLAKVEEGLVTLDRAGELYLQLGRPEELPSVEISRGVGFYDLGEYDRAEAIIRKAIATPDLSVDAFTMANVWLALGRLSLRKGELVAARDYLAKGLPLAEQANVLSLVTDFNKLLGKTYSELNEPELAYPHFATYADTIEQLFAQERLDVYSETAEQFSSQLREAEIQRQELVIAQQRTHQQLLWLGLGFLALLSLIILLLLRTRLKFQRSEAARLEAERQAEVKALQREAEVAGLRAMIEGQETERRRVAKDLHDGLGGLLATVKARLSSEAPTAAGANRLIDRACTEVRRIAHNMMPQTLALSGLTGSVRDIVTQLNQRGLDTELEIVGQPDLRLDEEAQAMLLRILQELTHNVVKHARANKLFLQLLDQPDQLLLTVEDDGVGFEADRALAAGKGIGLANITNRVAYLGGHIQYDASPGHGTTVTLTIPL